MCNKHDEQNLSCTCSLHAVILITEFEITVQANNTNIELLLSPSILNEQQFQVIHKKAKTGK